MNIKEFMEKFNFTEYKLKDLLDCSRASIYSYKIRDQSPALMRALQLQYLSNQELSINDMLSVKDKEKFERWKTKLEHLQERD